VSSPRISVVVTCHNLGAYLGAAVDSVLEQTFRDFEVVIVDDGSTEPETLKVLERYERPPTRVLRTENRGLPGARNLGVSASSGAYVCCLDADDLLLPSWLEKAAAVLDADAGLAYVSHWLRAFGDREWDWTPESCAFPALLDRNTVNGAALVRRDALLAVGGYDESMRQGCEDWELWVRLTARGYRGTILKEVHFLYRQRPDSMTRAMHRGAIHPAIFGEIVRRNEGAFREHLGPLLRRRHREIVDLKRTAFDLDHEWAFVREPERSFWQVEVEARRRKLASLEAARALRERAEALEARSAELGSELEASRLEREATRQEADAARREADAALRQAEALETSLSWRLTAPLRAAHRALFRLLG